MVCAGKGRVPPLASVGLVLIGAEPLHDDHRRLDRVHAGMHLPHMGGAAGDGHPCPHDAHLRHIERHVAGAGFGDDACVWGWQRVHDRQRAIAGTLLLDHGSQLHRGGRLQSSPAQRRHSPDDRRQPGLHIARAAAKHPAVAHCGLERWRGP